VPDELRALHRRLFTAGGAAKSELTPLPELEAADGLAEQANWIRRTGETPLEFLVNVYRNPLVELKERVSAARALLGYTHRALPNVTVVTGDANNPLKSTIVVQSARDKLLDRIIRLASGAEAGGEGSPSGEAPAGGSVK
jgi:hypothetical protein